MKNTREFVGLATALFGSHAWINGIARELGVSQSTASKWANGRADVPDGVIKELQQKVGIASHIPPWIEGEGISNGQIKTYLIHTHWPRFVARALSDGEQPDAEELPVASVSGFGLELVGIAWQDEPIGLSTTDILDMIKEAAVFLNQMDPDLS